MASFLVTKLENRLFNNYLNIILKSYSLIHYILILYTPIN